MYSKEEVVGLIKEYGDGMLPYHLFLKEKGLIEPELEIGKWYKRSLGTLICYNGNTDLMSGYGFNMNGDWTNGNFPFGDEWCEWTEATDKEVETALIKEAKKRGFKEGASVTIKADWISDGSTASNHMLNSPAFKFKDGYLIFGGMYIMKDGNRTLVCAMV